MNSIVGHSKQLAYLTKLLQGQQIPHTLLFAGPRGIGKMKVAEYLSRGLFCSAEAKPCGECEGCLKTSAHKNRDILVLEPDESGKIKVGDRDTPGTVRYFVHRMSERPIGKNYIGIIDGVDLITEAGQNILLKTVEEPGNNCFIIMLSATKSKVLQTVLSRSVVMEFFPLSYDEVSTVLGIRAEHHSIEDLAIIASGGSASLAHVLLEEEYVLKFIDLGERLKRAVLEEVYFNFDLKEVDNLPDGITFYDILINIFRHILMIAVEKRVQYNRHLEKLYIDDIKSLHILIKKLMESLRAMRINSNPQYALKSLVCQLPALIKETETGVTSH